MTDPLFLILSGTYVGPELVAEFGRLPPCFLPNGTQRLFEAQLAFGRTLATRVALTLPSDFDVPEFDLALLDTAGVDILRADASQPLSAGLAHALSTLRHDGRLFLLFGDTLVDFGETGSEPDSFASGTTRHLAVWADYKVADGRVSFHQGIVGGQTSREVVAGFFDFADAGWLAQCLSAAKDFVAALNSYAETRPFAPVPTNRWLDFGHLYTYHRSRRTELAARAFNRVVGDGLSVRKTGTPARKIFAEASWFETLPSRFRPFVPHFIALHRQPAVAYEIEYLYLPLLSELYCFAYLPARMWLDILASCTEFLELCQDVRPEPYEITADHHRHFFDDMIVGKTFRRLESFSEATGLSLQEPWRFAGAPVPPLQAVAEALIAAIRPSATEDICMWHGDFHFANIFFDFRSQRVKVVDPRGMLSDGTMTMFGDARYDIAKLTHSIVGMYDDLIAGRYRLDHDGRYGVDLNFRRDRERDAFVKEYGSLRIGRYGCCESEGLALVALLFLSMLPLHDNDRQRQFAMLANGLRLATLSGVLA